MRSLPGLLACGAAALTLGTTVPGPAFTAEADRAGSHPWVIDNGQPGSTLYMPREVQQAYARGTRSPDGRPGPHYWQNESTHRIRLTLNPPSRRVVGEQEIVYANNSPDPLPILVFRLYMNAHQAEAMREKPVDARFMTDGITVDEFSIDGRTLDWNDPANPLAAYNTRGSTIHALQLATPIAPRSSVRIRMRWQYDLVADSGWKEGAIDETTYFLAYFFPRVTNYSDYNGWDTSPFTLGREFNNDFADFEVAVEVPRDFVVWATGTLENPAEVLQPALQRKLEASFRSDEVATLADAADVQAAYPDSADDFRTIVHSARQTLQFASTAYPGVPYPYPKTTLVLGSADEEYPMMVNDASGLGNPWSTQLGGTVFTDFVAAHELLHSWFPFYMGINEKRYPFMDEGWTTAFEYLRNREAMGVESADALFRAFRSGGWTAPTSSFELPIVTPHDAMWGQSSVFGFNQYGKAALGFLALRDLMGDAAFRTALHEFMARWNGKRPLPWDLFYSFDDAAGGGLAWFFRNWFFSFSHSDLALDGVRDANGRRAVVVRNVGGMAVPFDMVLEFTDGSSERVHRTPAAWQADGRRTEVPLSGGKALRAVKLDTGIFPDANPGDNAWTAEAAASP